MDRRIRGVAERARTPGGAAGSLRSGTPGVWGTALTLVGATESHARLQAGIDAAEVAEQRLHLFARGRGLVGDPAAPRGVSKGHRGERSGGGRTQIPSPLWWGITGAV